MTVTVTYASCPTCGAAISIPQGVDHVVCEYCKRTLIIGHTAENRVDAASEKAREAEQNAGLQAQATIAIGLQATQVELHRLHLNQDIISAQIELGSVQAEMRNLEQSKSSRAAKRRLQELRAQESSVLSRIATLQASLYPSPTPTPQKASSQKRTGTGCVRLILVLALLSIAIGIGILILQSPGAGCTIGVIIGVVVFVVYGSRKNKSQRRR